LAPLGLRQPARVAPPPEYPLLFCPVSAFGRAPWARTARVPFTYSCRVFRPAGAWATQIALVEDSRDQWVTWAEPARTGRAPLSAVQITLCPLVPESAGPRVSGLASR
jgi:hypothetical protein